MPAASERIQQISESDLEGWEVYVEAKSRIRCGEEIIMLAIGDHDFDTPSQSVAACKTALDDGRHNYTAIQGEPGLLEAIAKVSTAASGVDVTTNQVVAVPGGQAGLYAAMQAVLNPGDHVIVISPHYVTYPGTIRSAGGEFTLVEALPENGFQPTADAISNAIQENTKAVLINSPNNPTGTIYSKETLDKLAQVCIDKDLWLISDEVYWALSMGNHVSPLSLPQMRQRTIVVQSMSKSHGMTGWRIGWLIAPEEMIYYLTQHNLVSNYGMCDFISTAAVAALNGEFGVTEIADRYQQRGEVFRSAIADATDLIPISPSGGMYIMLDVRSIAPNTEKFAFDLLSEKKIAVMPGESFGPSTAGHIRISLCQSKTKLREAATRLSEFSSNYSQ
ncbi:MAG: aminotransferase class I/II-fold pyridoxal phosphate-dependent enzyme [Pseudomonadota bacterium]